MLVVGTCSTWRPARFANEAKIHAFCDLSHPEVYARWDTRKCILLCFSKTVRYHEINFWHTSHRRETESFILCLEENAALFENIDATKTFPHSNACLFKTCQRIFINKNKDKT